MFSVKSVKIISLLLAIIMIVMSSCTKIGQGNSPADSFKESSAEASTESTLEENIPDPVPEIENLYVRADAFAGYISADGTKHPYGGHFTSDFIEVTPGEKIYFGPCNPNQDYQLHGYNSNRIAVDKNVRSTLVEEAFFPNGYVIYSYTPPKGVVYARFANPSKYNSVYTICREAIDTNAFLQVWGRETQTAL